MKKLLGALMLSVAPASVYAVDATPLFSVYAGAGNWTADYSGKLGDFQTDLSDLGYSDENNTYVYLALEHFVPVVPQVRIEHIDLSSSGRGLLEEQFQIGDVPFTVGAEVDSNIDLTFTDFVLYYEVAIIDFGITFRQFDAEVTAASVSEPSIRDSEAVDGVLPMGYLQTKIDLPLTGLYLTGNVNVISIDDKSVTDYRAAVGYGIELSFLAEIGLELGYRSFEIDLGDEEDFTGDFELSGAYFGANVKF